MTDGMSLGRQQAGQLTGTLTGPPERGHGIAAGIRVNQSFQRLDQLGVVLDQRLPSSSRVPYSLNGERWLSKAVDSPIDGRTRESAKTGDAGNTPSSQLLYIDGSDKVLLSLIQVRKQQAVFLLKFFCCAHTDSVTQCASFVTIINLRALTFRWKDYAHGGRQRTMTLDAIEFVRRFLMHVLPSGFVRIRHYGILANCHRREKLMRCRELLGATPMTDSDLLDSNSPPEPESPLTPTQVCPICGAGRMIVIEEFPPLTMALVPLAEPDRCFTCDSS